MNSRRLLVLITFIAAFLAGCAPSPERPDRPERGPAYIEQAESLARAGEYEEAALYYLSAAERAEPPRNGQLRLRAADLLVAAERYLRAGDALDLVERSTLRGRDALLFDLVAARVALERAAPAQALALLAGLEGRVPAEWRIRYHHLMAQALLADRQPLASARERMALGDLLIDPEQIRDNRDALFSALLQLEPKAMQQHLAALDERDPMHGWLALAFEVKTRLFEGEPMESALAEWREDYPGHPASDELADALVDRYREAFEYPDQVALLLPLSGRYARAAEAIRDGFFSAYYDRDGERPSVRLYDADRHPQGVIGAYRQAVNDGAGWVVGPLDREAVEMLLAQPALPVPVLALNYALGELPEARTRHLIQESVDRKTAEFDVAPPAMPQSDAPAFQFGLLPEQEARQAAEKLMADGHRRAMALAPDDEWGARMMRAFVERYTELGGYLTETDRFQPDQSDHSDTLRRMLALQEGQSRRWALEVLLGRDLNYVPRPRADADALFLAARPEQARLIKPQLNFFQAVTLPVYGTSHLYTGRTSPGDDGDLDGIIFCDAPWMLGDTHLEPPRTWIAERFPAAGGGAGRLFALGADAYRLIPYLGWLSDHPRDEYPGLSGRLVLDADNRVQRRLAWARFQGGRPVLINDPLPAPSLPRGRR